MYNLTFPVTLYIVHVHVHGYSKPIYMYIVLYSKATEPKLQYLPNAAIFSCTPAHVGHVWGGGNPFNPTLTAGPHLGGLKGVKIVESNVAIFCPGE